MEDYEMIEAENTKLNKKIKKAIGELDFAIKFVKAKGLITEGILEDIKRRLK